MSRKYDLAKMLEEIKEDERIIHKKKDRWASQADISEMMAAMKAKRKAERQG